MIEESNRPDVAGADPAVPQLVRERTGRRVARINRLTGRQQGEMPVARRAVVGEGVEAGVTGQVAPLQGNQTTRRVAQQIGAQREARGRTIRGRLLRGIARQDRIEQHKLGNPGAPDAAHTAT